MTDRLNYNPKIEIKFLSHLSDNHTYFESELRLKNIYANKTKPSTFSEHFFSRTGEAFHYIQESNELNIENLKTIINLFDKNVEIDIDRFEKLINCINTYHKDVSILSVTEIFIESMIAFENSDRQFSISILLCNYNRIQAGTYPLIFFNDIKFEIRNLISNYGLDQDKLFDVFERMEQKTNQFNKTHPFVSIEDILSKLQLMKDVLIKCYKLKSLKIYGSYSRGEETEYSDLDLFAEIQEVYVNNYNKKGLINYLKEEFSIPVDVLLKHEIKEKRRIPSDMLNGMIEVFAYD